MDFKPKRVVILHDRIPDNAKPDELDTFDQAFAVRDILEAEGYEVFLTEFSLDVNAARIALKSVKPDFVFNLVESVNGKGQLIHLAPSLMDSMELPYTGNSTETLFITSNKLIAKRIMRANGIPTADWIDNDTRNHRVDGAKYIVKSVWEHASIGIDKESIVINDKMHHVRDVIFKKEKINGGKFFAERFIKGREFNVSVLADRDAVGVDVLLPAEMRFHGEVAGDHFLDYNGKWDETSEEYDISRRTFDFQNADKPLLETVTAITHTCADVFHLRGYARVDFRVDEEGNPFVLEVNANPCISPDVGLPAACEHLGISYKEMIRRIVAERGFNI
jgi:D-alanine-D-alanine ligase